MYDEDTMVRSLLSRFGTLALSLTAAPVFPARLVGGLWAAFGHTKTTDHVLRRCSSVRLSTAVQGDIASTMHGLAMSIAAAHQCAYAVSVQTCGSSSIER